MRYFFFFLKKKRRVEYTCNEGPKHLFQSVKHNVEKKNVLKKRKCITNSSVELLHSLDCNFLVFTLPHTRNCAN